METPQSSPRPGTPEAPWAPMKKQRRPVMDVGMFYDVEDGYLRDGMDLLLIAELLDATEELLEHYPNVDLQRLYDYLVIQYERETVYEDTFRMVLYGAMDWCLAAGVE